MKRDFTYIDDIAQGVVRISQSPKKQKNPYALYNIGNNNPVDLLYMIEVLEEKLGYKATKEMLPMQPGDVPETFADIDSLTEDFAFQPKTSIEDGIDRFVAWYKSYYNV
jgi:UDP-glucuronate 4-epimerase